MRRLLDGVTLSEIQTRSRPLRVAVMGTWNWLEVAAELLRRAGMECKLFPDFPTGRAFLKFALGGGLKGFDAVHHVRGTSWFYGSVFRLIRKPVIWHWIGTDVLEYSRTRFGGGDCRSRIARRAIHKWAAGHLADSPELAGELGDMGIRADVVRLLPKAIEADVQPLPPRPGVLSYWGPEHRDFYRCGIIMRLAEAFPDVPFIIVGDHGNGVESPPNVKFLGRLPSLADVYPQVSVYVRLVEHDSLSAIVLEAMARGRYVIYSRAFPHTQTAQDFDQAKAAMEGLLRRMEPDVEAAGYIRSTYNLDDQARQLGRIYGKLFG